MDLFEDTPGDNAPEFSVSEIAGTVRRLIEGELSYVRVRGEVGRVTLARSGHLYFDLKDDKSVLSCMTWKGQVSGLGTMPEEGMEVIAEGKMTASGFSSKFALNAVRVAVAGEGALMAMLEKRKKKLAAEGLFEEARKKPLPYLPEIIGVVTSPQGAVIRDILHRLRDRFPRKVLIWPVAVQGEACAPQVANAIRGFNALTPGGALPRPDLLIVARGGGSIEDLWGFNEEIVARAAAESDIPLISAVGHETDITLIDFTSDKRAPTPTAAAELAVPVRLDLMAWTDAQEARISRAIGNSVSRRKEKLRDLIRVLPRADALLNEPRQRLDRADDALPRVLRQTVERRAAKLSEFARALRPATLRTRIKTEETRLNEWSRRLGPALTRGVDRRRDRLNALHLRSAPITQKLERQYKDFNALAPKLDAAFTIRLARAAEKIDALDRLRRSIGYEETLKRGYSVVRAGETIVTGAEAAKSAASLEIQFKDGRVSVTPDGAAPKPKSRKKKPDQGSLF
ncbi:exodeoxyribonuclease VII large subunit [Boseongicola aestuarii]|uniref:Exodeoxyribonuclease 7 large subunit n=1 Tax=Boseongicola aestuarii TaxID=1470561 RepID=A0A238J4K2_9RHOB|nr:exodeoxyribonuclease VII large subunit [Boseongicola aestuarii]SMX24834.1 Exodeoxyribonuclease 7 large subunit [Boseongicola aestuarii]